MKMNITLELNREEFKSIKSLVEDYQDIFGENGPDLLDTKVVVNLSNAWQRLKYQLRVGSTFKVELDFGCESEVTIASVDFYRDLIPVVQLAVMAGKKYNTKMEKFNKDLEIDYTKS